MDHLRHIKGALATVISTIACHAVLSYGLKKSHEAGEEQPDVVLGGAVEFLLAVVIAWTLMPVLLAVLMRLSGEKGNHLLVLVCGLVWPLLSGYFLDEIDDGTGRIPLVAIVLYVLLGTLLAGNRHYNGRE
ncbi:hypothetical protein AAHZ94_02215 [Streptomyces sp. HSW2009]|uniref:hypothetical protein n=1 Tax=Streptomyces sp. HSW2009 TaxID=3142890 RepID=UPI0032EDFE10